MMLSWFGNKYVLLLTFNRTWRVHLIFHCVEVKSMTMFSSGPDVITESWVTTFIFCNLNKTVIFNIYATRRT